MLTELMVKEYEANATGTNKVKNLQCSFLIFKNLQLHKMKLEMFWNFLTFMKT